jgi:hypothetical protein
MTDTQATTLLDQAAGLMHAGAALAESRGGDDNFSDWHGLASQIRLTATGVSHDPATVAPSSVSITACLVEARDTLDRIRPLAGPPDLTLWLWHLHELRRIAEAMERR